MTSSWLTMHIFSQLCSTNRFSLCRAVSSFPLQTDRCRNDKLFFVTTIYLYTISLENPLLDCLKDIAISFLLPGREVVPIGYIGRFRLGKVLEDLSNPA